MTTITTLPDIQRRPRSRSNRETLSPAMHRLAILLALVLGLPLLYGGSRLVGAAIASYQAEAFLKDWQRKGSDPSERAWEIAQDAAQRAIALSPSANGDYLHRLGLVTQWRHMHQPLGIPEAEASRRAALHAFRAATEVRPAWPAHWTALAWIKLQQLEFDDEFGHTLAEAHRLGPWRIEINRGLAEIGLIAWPQLSADQQETVLETARRTVSFGHREAVNLHALARQTGRTSELCQALDESLKKRQKICL